MRRQAGSLYLMAGDAREKMLHNPRSGCANCQHAAAAVLLRFSKKVIDE